MIALRRALRAKLPIASLATPPNQLFLHGLGRLRTMAKLSRYPLARIDEDAVRACAAAWIAGLWAQEKVTTATTWDKEAVMIGSRRAGHIGYRRSEPGPGCSIDSCAATSSAGITNCGPPMIALAWPRSTRNGLFSI